MARRGPPPKPSALREQSGNAGHRRINHQEPKPVTKEPPKPAWLKGHAAKEWKRIVPELLQLGLLAKIDQTALASYCQATAELMLATKVLDKEGRVVDSSIFSRNGEEVGTKRQAHPAVGIQQKAFRAVITFLREFGLSPAARVHIQTEQDTDDASHDELGEVLHKMASPPPT
ncbi:MAG: phage terminase small subunit P27 family [Gemmataceae bacterium]